jgi:hypothetical protein
MEFFFLKENEGGDLAGDERMDGWMVIWCLFDTFVGIFGMWSYMLLCLLSVV